MTKSPCCSHPPHAGRVCGVETAVATELDAGVPVTVPVRCACDAGQGAEAKLEASATKDTNPKDAIGTGKIPLHLLPPPALALAALGHLDGALKYGKYNWRIAGVRFTVYLDALKRHTEAILAGEETDPDSGLPHEAHLLATVNIAVDARACGKLIDDRPPRIPGYRAWLDETTRHVPRLQAKHAGRNPRHYTVADEVVPIASSESGSAYLASLREPGRPS